MESWRTLVGALAAAALLAPAGLEAQAAQKSFKNCTALNRVYPQGVGMPGARDRTSDTPVTNFRRSRNLYRHNDGKAPRRPGERDLDRDNDRITCEKL